MCDDVVVHQPWLFINNMCILVNKFEYKFAELFNNSDICVSNAVDIFSRASIGFFLHK